MAAPFQGFYLLTPNTRSNRFDFAIPRGRPTPCEVAGWLRLERRSHPFFISDERFFGLKKHGQHERIEFHGLPRQLADVGNHR